jgi:hypothetical protein
MNEDIDIVRSIMVETGTPDPEVRARARAELIAAAGSHPRVSRKRHRRLIQVLHSRPRLGTVLVDAAIAAGVAAGLVVAVTGRDSVVRPPAASAATVLGRAADAVTDGMAANPGPGQYLYTKTIWVTNDSDSGTADANGDPASVLVTQIDDTWQNAQGGIQTRTTVKVDGTPVHASQIIVGNSHARSHATRYGTVDGTLRLSSGGLGPFTYAQLEAMPTNATSLRAEIAKLADNGSQDNGSQTWINHEMFTVIHDILLEQLVPIRLRAALYRVAATIPGVTVLGPTNDAAGRQTLVVSFSDSLYRERDELLFDPKTYLLTGESEVNARTGQIEESEAVVKSQVVNAMPKAVQSSAR